MEGQRGEEGVEKRRNLYNLLECIEREREGK